MPDRRSYVKVLIAFDPSMVPPRITAPRRVLHQCDSWSKTCSAMHDGRRYTALVTDINGANPRQTIEVAARLASMVPFVSDPVLFPGSTDLWTTTEKFLSLGCGDEEEHATLLCCWLLSCGIPCCLVLGFALPEGARAAYVLVNLSDGIYLVNPSDGSVYSSTDAMCPLTSVGTIVAPRNKSSDWKPLFDKEMDDFQSIQSSSVPYTQVSEDALIELRSSIERDIKLRFDEARQYGIPQWNLMASRLLREILQDEQRSADDRLTRLRESYAVTLCSVTIPYRNIQDCVSAVLRCGLHTTTSASPQFALAVHLQSPFGHVISCSIAIALLTLKI
ncbi:hypothetical protein TELCIR_07128 [Teladorsagia circumcincta]|uniref:CEP76/DRC7 peptidase-like domain-containing protein n=1 Tax=Teladorsagia circumcincta TaxID=45464 RepID=A0A2G9UL52_TELCI|nr:hypothetical protein TELCIR_07128 [Teladorsagia circumcincta]